MKKFKKFIFTFLLIIGLLLCLIAGLFFFKFTTVPFGFLFNTGFYLFAGSMLLLFLMLAFLCSKSSKKRIKIVGIVSRILFIIIAVITVTASFSYDFRVLYFKHKNPDLIYEASSGGSIKTVESLLKDGFDLNKNDKDGWTLLHCAASEGKVEMLEYLIGKGIDKNARNKQGETAYNVAVFFNLSEAADYLKRADVNTSVPKFPELTGPYMGQKPPGDTPELFLPGIVSGHYQAHTPIVFSPDGKEAYWTVGRLPEGIVVGMEMVDGIWNYPKLSTTMRGEPAFSPDGKRLYFISLKPLRNGERDGKENIWYMEKTDSGWSEPKPVGDAVNSRILHWQPSVDSNYNLYFSDYSNMFYSRYENGEYQEPVNITELFGNETLKGNSPYISPDGDYLLFSAQENLCISFKKEDGTWTDKINLGNEIRGKGRVTPDGKYIFFTYEGKDKPGGIYWVSAAIIEKLKKEHLKDD